MYTSVYVCTFTDMLVPVSVKNAPLDKTKGWETSFENTKSGAGLQCCSFTDTGICVTCVYIYIYIYICTHVVVNNKHNNYVCLLYY